MPMTLKIGQAGHRLQIRQVGEILGRQSESVSVASAQERVGASYGRQDFGVGEIRNRVSMTGVSINNVGAIVTAAVTGPVGSGGAALLAATTGSDNPG